MASEGKLKGKVAIVLGGSGGMGRDICVTLAGDGASIVVNYAGNLAAANETVRLVEAAGSKAIAVKGDVGKAADVVAIFDKAEEAFGEVHIVHNAAGILPENYPNVVDMDEDVWDSVMTTNAKGTFLVAREAAKRLGPGGRIIATSSSQVVQTFTGYAAYSASKAAIEALIKTLSKELRGRRITANCIAPGPVATEMFYKGKTDEKMEFMKKLPPLERLGEPKDISAVVQFLASDASEWINGQVIRLNGGVV